MTTNDMANLRSLLIVLLMTFGSVAFSQTCLDRMQSVPLLTLTQSDYNSLPNLDSLLNKTVAIGVRDAQTLHAFDESTNSSEVVRSLVQQDSQVEVGAIWIKTNRGRILSHFHTSWRNSAISTKIIKVSFQSLLKQLDKREKISEIKLYHTHPKGYPLSRADIRVLRYLNSKWRKHLRHLAVPFETNAIIQKHSQTYIWSYQLN